MENLYAVLTGDLISSSRFEKSQRARMLAILKTAFNKVNDSVSSDNISSQFEIYRGDSFQGVISKPEMGLTAALCIRACLLSGFRKRTQRLDARIAIGIGTIDYLPKHRGGEGDGEAFRNSGMSLNKMKKSGQKMIIKTPWPEVNDEFIVECSLLDALINRWTYEQSQAALKQLQGLKQKEIAQELGISQSAVGQRLTTGGMHAVREFVKRYKMNIENNIRARPDNPALKHPRLIYD